MFYKIDNKECQVYKNVHALRTKELEMETENKTLITEKTGLEWKGYLGHPGQQNFNRVTEYCGLRFTSPNLVNPKIWKKDESNEGIFLPYTRTKLGREMAAFLNNGLKGSCFTEMFKAIGVLDYGNRFTIPFVDIENDIIYIYMDDFEDLDSNIEEITKKEFKESTGRK